MMVTNEEKKAAAERIRSICPREYAYPVEIVRAALGLKKGDLMSHEVRENLAGVMADLIDPDSTNNKPAIGADGMLAKRCMYVLMVVHRKLLQNVLNQDFVSHAMEYEVIPSGISRSPKLLEERAMEIAMRFSGTYVGHKIEKVVVVH